MNVLELQNLQKHYATHKAVDDISFSIPKGSIFGLLGPNGAGKTTTLKMLSGLLYPTNGGADVLGYTPWERKKPFQRQISLVMGQKNQLWWDLPLMDSLKLIGKLYRVEPDRFRKNLDRLVEQLGIGGFLQTPVRQLSLGQRMRGDLAAAMLYEPRILYLDEPTVGLDVVAKERTRQFVEEVNRELGTTIILTTHDLADVERLCTRIVFIDKGKVLYDGSVSELKRRYAPWRVLDITLAPGAADEPESPVTLRLDGVEIDEQTEAHLLVRFDPEKIAVTDIITAVIGQRAVSDISIIEPDLEGVVREIVEQGEVHA